MLGEIYFVGVVVALPVLGVLVARREEWEGWTVWCATTVMAAVMWPIMAGFVLLGGVGEVGDAPVA